MNKDVLDIKNFNLYVLIMMMVNMYVMRMLILNKHIVNTYVDCDKYVVDLTS